MSRQTRALALLCTAVGAVLATTAARADSITQTVTLPPTTTDFSGSAAQLNIPLFNPAAYSTTTGSAVLDSVTLNFSANIQNQYTMTFIDPATITDSAQTVGAGATGPTITLFQPDKTTALLTAQEPNTVAELTRTVTYDGGTSGNAFPQTYSSTLPTTSPYYIAPSSATATQNQTLTSAADLALFTKSATGPASLSLPVVATANSSTQISSGNGAGGVSTTGDASATVTYTYHLTAPAAQTGQGPAPALMTPTPTPEPATLLLWGVGGVALVASRRVRRRA